MTFKTCKINMLFLFLPLWLPGTMNTVSTNRRGPFPKSSTERPFTTNGLCRLQEMAAQFLAIMATLVAASPGAVPAGQKGAEKKKKDETKTDNGRPSDLNRKRSHDHDDTKRDDKRQKLDAEQPKKRPVHERLGHRR